jgi:thioredoxin-related protein
VFDATIPKFRDVEFRKIDITDPGNADLVQRFEVRGIPRAVFLDGSGNVLYNGGCPRDPAQFENLINQHH